jgi:hypothetical protein
MNWELSVLSRAIAFSNLSGASGHIGISQPQLSRIVKKLELEHEVILLDRTVKRKSVWTPDAFKLAELYTKLVQQFRLDVGLIGKVSKPMVLRLGSLEGLIDEALHLTKGLYASLKLAMIELTIGDLSDLEERYFKGSLDLLLTSREPGKKKIERCKIVGYQSLDIEGPAKGIRVLSTFEYTSQRPKMTPSTSPIFVSNSLVARTRWIKDHGGIGTLPSAVQKKPKKSVVSVPVHLIGLDYLPADYWDTAVTIAR